MAKKTKLTTWISRDALRSLRDLAATHRLTVSQVAADILDRGLKEHAETAGLGLLGPAVEGVVKREVGWMSDRLAHLIARTALESATARRLVFQLLVRQLAADEARRLNQAAWTGSVDSLRKPAEGLREILGPRESGPERHRTAVILRAAYATRGRGGLGRAKAGARYVIHRPSDTSPREYRTGFDADHDRMEKDEVYDRLEARTAPTSTASP